MFNVVKTSLHVRNVENFDLQRESCRRDLKIRSELRKEKYESFFRNFRDESAFVRITDIFKLRRFELERVN